MVFALGPSDGSAPGRRRGRPVTRPSEDAIHDAALTAFAETGFAGASMRDIAARAGTSLSNLYNYVPSKGHLLAGLLSRANDGLLERLRAADDPAESAPDRLARVVAAYTHWTTENRLASLVALTEVRHLDGDQRTSVVAARDTTEALIAGIVQAGVQAGAFTTHYPRGAARGVTLLCAAMATWYRPDGGSDADALAVEQADHALALVGCKPAQYAGSEDHRGG